MKWQKFEDLRKQYPLGVWLTMPMLGGPHPECSLAYNQQGWQEYVEDLVGYIAPRPFESLDLQACSEFRIEPTEGDPPDGIWDNKFVFPKFKGNGFVYTVIGDKFYTDPGRRMPELRRCWSPNDTKTPLNQVFKRAQDFIDERFAFQHSWWKPEWTPRYVLKKSWEMRQFLKHERISIDIYDVPSDFRV